MIIVDVQRGKFQISCLPFEADLVSGLPNRRFNQNKGIWTAPIIRLNVERIKKWEVKKTPAAIAAIEGCDNIVTNTGELFPQNYEFKTKPFPHQRTALDKVYPLKCSALFMDVGTGKTKVAIDNACAHFQMGHIKRVVVICLVSIKRNWGKEIQMHGPGPSNIILLKTTKKAIKELGGIKEAEHLSWVIVGVESLSAGKAFSLIEGLVDEQTMVIVDESSRIKNHKAKRTEKTIELGMGAGYRMIMTGTPVTQGAGDLYSQFEFLDPSIIGIGNYYSFRNRYVILGGYENKQVIGYKKMEELTETLAPYIYQVRKREVLTDLPDFTHKRYEVELSKEQAKLYQDLKDRMRLEYESKILVVKNVMNMMQRFSEIVGGNVSYEIENPDPFSKQKRPTIYKRQPLKSNPKLDLLLTILEDMPIDEPIVIWASGKDEITQIRQALAKKFETATIGEIHGGIKEDLRHQYVEDFQKGKVRFLVGNPSVGGIGLNMTAAATMIYFNRDFSLEKCIQSEGRIDRIGQTRAMTYIDLVCRKTIDEYVLDALQSKYDFAEQVRSSFDEGKFLGMV